MLQAGKFNNPSYHLQRPLIKPTALSEILLPVLSGLVVGSASSECSQGNSLALFLISWNCSSEGGCCVKNPTLLFLWSNVKIRIIGRYKANRIVETKIMVHWKSNSAAGLSSAATKPSKILNTRMEHNIQNIEIYVDFWGILFASKFCPTADQGTKGAGRVTALLFSALNTCFNFNSKTIDLWSLMRLRIKLEGFMVW